MNPWPAGWQASLLATMLQWFIIKIIEEGNRQANLLAITLQWLIIKIIVEGKKQSKEVDSETSGRMISTDGQSAVCLDRVCQCTVTWFHYFLWEVLTSDLWYLCKFSMITFDIYVNWAYYLWPLIPLTCNLCQQRSLLQLK